LTFRAEADVESSTDDLGIESAGIVLAVIPLVLKGLESYRKPKARKSLRQAERERGRFARKLQQLNSELRFLILELFTPIAPLLMQGLTAPDIGGAKFFDLWNDIVNTNLEAIEDAFEQMSDDITDILDHMAEVLKEMIQHTEQPIAARQLLKEIIRNDKNDPNFSIKRNISKRFRFEESDSRRLRILEEIENDIAILKNHHKEQETKEFPVTRRSVQSHKFQVPHLDRIRDYSFRIHDVLSDIWLCNCHKPLSAMLRLERREAPKPNEADSPRFSVVFTFEHYPAGHPKLWAYQEVDIRVGQMWVLSKYSMILKV
jgi:hypothetical protein